MNEQEIFYVDVTEYDYYVSENSSGTHWMKFSSLFCNCVVDMLSNQKI